MLIQPWAKFEPFCKFPEYSKGQLPKLLMGDYISSSIFQGLHDSRYPCFASLDSGLLEVRDDTWSLKGIYPVSFCMKILELVSYELYVHLLISILSTWHWNLDFGNANQTSFEHRLFLTKHYFLQSTFNFLYERLKYFKWSEYCIFNINIVL